jgi:hypothetical protein
MSALESWLRAEARRQADRPDLASALLAGRPVAYARRRIGFMALRMVLRSGLTALELQLLLWAFVPFEVLAPLIAVRAVCGLIGAAQWGGLEALRARVRKAWVRREPARVRAVVERFYAASALVSAAGSCALLLACAAAVGFDPASIELQHAYWIACAGRLSMELPNRVLHSGVYAVRRVYRPLWSVVLPDVIEIATLALGFELLGVWSIPVGILLAGALDAGLTRVYVLRAYRGARLEQPVAWRGVRAWLRPKRSERSTPTSEIAGHAVANLLLQLDALVLLVLLGARAPQTGPSLALLYYSLWPLAAISTHWVRTFYFDLKLIQAGPLAALGVRLSRFLARLAVGMGLSVGLSVAAIAALALDFGSDAELLWLVPFFVVRSGFALWQIVAFSAGRYRALVAATLVVLAGLGAIAAFDLSELRSLIGITLLLSSVLALATRGALGPRSIMTRASTAQPPESEAEDRRELTAGVQRRVPTLALTLFFARLACEPRVQLGMLTLRPNAPRALDVARALGRAHPALTIARWGRRHLLVSSAGAEELLTLPALIVASGGSFARAWLSPALQPTAALARAQHAGVLPEGLRELLRPDPSAPDLSALSAIFRVRFPTGDICDLTCGRGDLSARAADPQQLRLMLGALRALGHGGRARAERRLRYQIAAYAPCGRVQVVFVVDRAVGDFAAFRALVERAGVRASWPEALDEAALLSADAVHA